MKNDNIFRSAFFITFLHIYAGFSALVFIDDGLKINLKAFGVASIGVLVLTIFAIFFIKISVDECGIKGYNFWGKYRKVKWEDVYDVKPIRIIGLKYLRVFYKAETGPLWIPLFLSDMTKFEKKIEALTSVSNPIRMFFANTHNVKANV